MRLQDSLKKSRLQVRNGNPVLLFLGVFVSFMFLLLQNSLVFLSGFCFSGFLRVREVRIILGVFEVFLGIFEKTKEKKEGNQLKEDVSAGRPCGHPAKKICKCWRNMHFGTDMVRGRSRKKLRSEKLRLILHSLVKSRLASTQTLYSSTICLSRFANPSALYRSQNPANQEERASWSQSPLCQHRPLRT